MILKYIKDYILDKKEANVYTLHLSDDELYLLTEMVTNCPPYIGRLSYKLKRQIADNYLSIVKKVDILIRGAGKGKK